MAPRRLRRGDGRRAARGAADPGRVRGDGHRRHAVPARRRVGSLHGLGPIGAVAVIASFLAEMTFLPRCSSSSAGPRSGRTSRPRRRRAETSRAGGHRGMGRPPPGRGCAQHCPRARPGLRRADVAADQQRPPERPQGTSRQHRRGAAPGGALPGRGDRPSVLLAPRSEAETAAHLARDAPGVAIVTPDPPVSGYAADSVVLSVSPSAPGASAPSPPCARNSPAARRARWWAGARPPSTRKKLRTRRALADAALRLFTENGYDATTLEEVADQADVSKSTFFRFFPVKEAAAIEAEAELWSAYLDALNGRELSGEILEVLHHTLAAAAATLEPSWDERFLTTRRLVAAEPALPWLPRSLPSRSKERADRPAGAKAPPRRRRPAIVRLGRTHHQRVQPCGSTMGSQQRTGRPQGPHQAIRRCDQRRPGQPGPVRARLGPFGADKATRAR